MRFSSIIQMGKEYALLGILAIAVIAVLYCIGYFVVYRKWMKGTKKPNPLKLVLGAVLLIYLVVVFGATILSRGGYMTGTVNTLFSSYRWAWYSFDETEWRNLILNICMFIPFGFLLPLLSEKMRTFWKTYLAGFLATVLIEGIQLLSGRGAFEMDDVLNNLLGTMIGYGIVYLVLWGLRRKAGKKRSAVFLQLPLILTVVFFGVIFLVYEQKEYGNMLSDYSMHLKNMDVTCDLQLSDAETEENIYHLKKYDEQETLDFANTLFRQLDTVVDESGIDAYQDTIIYWSQDRNYNLWVDYRGLSFRYTDFNCLNKVPVNGASREEIVSALEKLNIRVPEQAEFSSQENGYYEFSVSGYEDGENWVEGTLSCQYVGKETLGSVNQHICSYEKYSTCGVISEQEALQKLENGDCQMYFVYNEAPIKIVSVRLAYEMDSKGFYRPVYYFSAEIEGEEREIAVSALG